MSLPLDDRLLSACIHCGLCLESCATFVETGREESSPRGRLVLLEGLASGRWNATPEVLRHLDSCLGCRSCERACPSGVRYGPLLEAARDLTAGVRAAPRSRMERFLVRHVLWRAGLLTALARGLRLLGADRWVPQVAGLGVFPPSWRRTARLFPPLEAPPARRARDASATGPPAYLLRGCAARAFFPATEGAMETLLAAAGYRVTRLDAPACCGALARHLGEADLARRLVAPLLSLPLEPSAVLVATAAGCGAHLKELPGLFSSDGDAAESAAALARRTLDLSEALLAGPRPLVFRSGVTEGVVFQDPCHLRQAQGVFEAPRELLRAAGARLLDTPEADLCCGSAGTFNLGQAGMGERLGRRKAERLAATGARLVVTANPGCHVQLVPYVKESGLHLEPLALFLAGRLAADGRALARTPRAGTS